MHVSRSCPVGIAHPGRDLHGPGGPRAGPGLAEKKVDHGPGVSNVTESVHHTICATNATVF